MRGPSLEYATWLCSLIFTEHGVQLALIVVATILLFKACDDRS